MMEVTASSPLSVRSEDEQLDLLMKVGAAKLKNFSLAQEEYYQGALQVQSMPVMVNFELTQNCNFKCPMCPQSIDPRFKSFNPNYNMPLPLIERIAKEVFPLAAFVDLRGFGESTILPYWHEVTEMLEDFPLTRWHLITNLSHTRIQTWENMIRLGFVIGFSCDGASAEVFEKVRFKSKFHKILENLNSISALIKEYDSGGIYFISTIQPANAHEMKDIVRLAAENNAAEVQFKIVQPNRNVSALTTLHREKIKNYVEQSIAMALERQVRVAFNDWVFTRDIPKETLTQLEAIPHNFKIHPDMLRLQKGGRIGSDTSQYSIIEKVWPYSKVSILQKCFKPYGLTFINHLGQVGTCNHMMYPDMLVMGDLREETFASAWNSEAYQKFRAQLASAKPEDSRCKWCFAHRLDD